MVKPKIFVCYSHVDKNRKDRLLTHLAPLEADFELWTDRKIQAGENWESAIETALATATLAIMLVSADFLSSKFIRNKEIPPLLERRKKEGMDLLPILAKDCAWRAVPWLDAIEMRPLDAKPVWRSGGRYIDYELARIVEELDGKLQLAIRVQQAGETKRQKAVAEWRKRKKGKAIAVVVADSPAAEALYSADEASEQKEASRIHEKITAGRFHNPATRASILRELQQNIIAIVQDDPSSGILLHPTSLPGPYGIGELGTEAHGFADFLRDSGQRIWQVLPLGPTGYGDSPYQCFSAFAGNPLLISLDTLVEHGYLELG